MPDPTVGISTEWRFVPDPVPVRAPTHGRRRTWTAADMDGADPYFTCGQVVLASVPGASDGAFLSTVEPVADAEVSERNFVSSSSGLGSLARTSDAFGASSRRLYGAGPGGVSGPDPSFVS